MAISSNASGKTEDIQNQISRLREQVESMMKDRVTPAVSDFAGRAGDVVHTASQTARQQADMVAGQVKGRPLTAILLAAAIGWVLGRAMR